ncbi:hypothetical protein EV356DRAFT_569839 [Viridothelium virens]|uniref:Uncharacterized protein n=1 Tax=Viridothelium virens TaxID=1048519 RepID=A0A6A6GZW0_VIRVR|nr:hypothetical protein EV356DRAFT_569839 [Viridothelium virens]
MHFSQLLIPALVTSLGLVATTSASVLPRNGNGTFDGPDLVSIAEIIEVLESQGNITWQDTNGGRVVTVGGTQFQSAKAKVHSKRAELHPRKLKWSSVGQILGTGSSSACFGKGQWFTDSVAQPYVTKACDSFLSSFSAGTLANAAWTIWQNSPQAQDPQNSKTDVINFAIQPTGSNPPKLTQEMCTQAYDLLTSSQCQGQKSNQNGQSQGGEIAVGDVKGAAMEFLLQALETGKGGIS